MKGVVYLNYSKVTQYLRFTSILQNKEKSKAPSSIYGQACCFFTHIFITNYSISEKSIIQVSDRDRYRDRSQISHSPVSQQLLPRAAKGRMSEEEDWHTLRHIRKRLSALNSPAQGQQHLSSCPKPDIHCRHRKLMWELQILPARGSS